MEATLFFDKIGFVLKQHGDSPEILNVCLDILAYLQDYGIDYLLSALKRTDILPVLEDLNIPQSDLSRKRDILVDYILSQEEGPA